MNNTANATTAIFKLSKDFSDSMEINTLVRARCIKAVMTKSMDGLCKEIELKTWKNSVVKMSSEEIEAKMKEAGLWQVVTNAMTRVTPTFTRTLDYLLLCSFGYSEVESEIKKRSIEAVETGSMEPLKRSIDMVWRNGHCRMSAEDVEKRLKEKGIWQLVEKEIKKD